MDEKDSAVNGEVVELSEVRSIVSLPSETVLIDIECYVFDEDKEDVFSARKSMNNVDVQEAFRKAEEGYFSDDEDEMNPDHPGEDLAMICLPENTVSVSISCRVFDDKKMTTVVKELGQKELRRAFRLADEGYIDDEDTFVLTDKGRALLQER